MQLIMDKKTLFLIIISLFLVAGLIGWWFLGASSDQKGPEIDGDGFFSSLFPDLGPSGRDEQESDGTASTTTPADATPSRLYKLVPESISGALFIKSSGRIRYIERATGHVYDIDPDGKNKTRISNTTVPGVFDVAWAPDGSRAIIKYPSSSGLNILSARFNASTTLGVFLPADIKEVLFSLKGDRIAYVIESASGGNIITASPDNKNTRTVFRNPFYSWTLLWPEENIMYLTTRPSAFVDGFAYRLNVTSGAFEKIAGPRSGLLFSTDGKSALLAEADQRKEGALAYTVNLKTGEATQIEARLIPEKCAWSKKEKNVAFCAFTDPFPRSVVPDDWYQGKLLFADSFAKIDTAKGGIEKIPSDTPLDAYKPFLSAEEDKLFFTNRYDGSLWGLRIK